MRLKLTLLLSLTAFVGCVPAQSRQAAQAVQNAKVAANLKAAGEAMHNDPKNLASESAADATNLPDSNSHTVEGKIDAPE
ncbi:MAG: hypothetical protein KDB03_16280 [Planctomycetales bacterium]|nr:hypothetical protein [Planctomycetales bacterium]